MKSKITIVEDVNEEWFEVKVDDVYIQRFDHDTHGYSAMSDIKKMIIEIAEKLDLTIIEEYDE